MSDDNETATKFTVKRRREKEYLAGPNKGKPYIYWESVTITEIHFDGKKWTATYEWSTCSYGYPDHHSRKGKASTLPQAVENLYRALNSQAPDWGNDLTVETP